MHLTGLGVVSDITPRSENSDAPLPAKIEGFLASSGDTFSEVGELMLSQSEMSAIYQSCHSDKKEGKKINF